MTTLTRNETKEVIKSCATDFEAKICIIKEDEKKNTDLTIKSLLKKSVHMG